MNIKSQIRHDYLTNLVNKNIDLIQKKYDLKISRPYRNSIFKRTEIQEKSFKFLIEME